MIEVLRKLGRYAQNFHKEHPVFMEITIVEAGVHIRLTTPGQYTWYRVVSWEEIKHTRLPNKMDLFVAMAKRGLHEIRNPQDRVA